MAQAWALRVSQMYSDDLGRLFVSYDVFVQRDDGTTRQVDALVEATVGMTPQQFRAALTAAVIYNANVQAGATVVANDCMVDVVQRGT